MKNRSIIVFFLLCTSVLAKAQDITHGTWFNEEKTGKVQFFKQGDKLFGKVVWLKDPLDNGKPRMDTQNPDPKLRNRHIVGLVNLKNFVSSGKNTWDDGEIYDPKTGKTYSCKITMASPTQLKIRGFIGFSLIGHTTVFTKAD